MIYTFYTDSHQHFLNDWFLSSIIEKDKVHVEKFEQKCPSGTFMQKGWHQTMLDKVNYIRTCLQGAKPFFHLDCDVQFFDTFYDDYMAILEENQLDLLAQNDGNNTACCGFMLIRPGDKMRGFWDEVYELVKVSNAKGTNDQIICNHLLPRRNVRFQLLGSDCFSIWMSNGQREWVPNHGLSDLPEKLKVHHANYTAGIDNKLELMKLVKTRHQSTLLQQS